MTTGIKVKKVEKQQRGSMVGKKYREKNAENKDDTWSGLKPSSCRLPIAGRFRIRRAESNFDGSSPFPSRARGSSIWKRVAKELERADLDARALSYSRINQLPPRRSVRFPRIDSDLLDFLQTKSPLPRDSLLSITRRFKPVVLPTESDDHDSNETRRR